MPQNVTLRLSIDDDLCFYEKFIFLTQLFFMKVLIAASAGWIAFSLVDQAVFNGRIVSGLPNLARAIASGFGFYF